MNRAARGRAAGAPPGARLLPTRGWLPVLGTMALLAVSCRRDEPASGPGDFVGSTTCATCHAPQHTAWMASQHALAMQEPRPGTVLGRFDDGTFTFGGVTSTFRRRGDRYVVNTEGPDGKLHDFEVRYTFGVEPIQQYLVALPEGRLQALALAWDTRPAAQGGQRWFSLDSEEGIPPTDEFHWSAWEQNWNYMCADCHSTGVRKAYDAEAHRFETTFEEVNVACEACHGPGSRHTRWAREPAWVRRVAWRDNGLPAQLTERRDAHWVTDSSLPTAYRSAPRRTDREIEVCAQCHSRRVQIAGGYTPGQPFLDFHDPSLLMAGLFHPDGQQQDEVFMYASYLQSRMYHAGVTCSDCHEPHSGSLRHPGNGVCTQCHRAATFDTTAHHFHPTGSAGAACASCHLAPTTYMQIDPRRDHSLRVPRPDLSVAQGVPNACNRCHADRDARWAAAQVRAWYGHTPVGFQRFAGAFAADDSGRLGAADSLLAVADDTTHPVIVRASAVARLARYPASRTREAVASAARHADPLVRRGALYALEAFPLSDRLDVVPPLLSDPVRVNRIQAAWLLAPATDSLPEATRRAFDAAAAELVASHRYNADRSSSRLTLGTFYGQLGHLDSAMAEYRAALRIAPRSVQAWLNLAGIQSVQGREDQAERTLRDAVARTPDEARLHHALGLSLARSGRLEEALAALERAAGLSSAAEFAYAYAVALHSSGRPREAIRRLEAARRRHPNDRNLLFALAAYYRDAGDTTAAIRHARHLLEYHPDDTQAQALLRSLEPDGR
jgi:tetratricopeptide (TPR) repeat protein